MLWHPEGSRRRKGSPARSGVAQGGLDSGRAPLVEGVTMEPWRGGGGGNVEEDSHFFLLLTLFPCWSLPLAKPIPAGRGALVMELVEVSRTRSRSGWRRMGNGRRASQGATSQARACAVSTRDPVGPLALPVPPGDLAYSPLR